MISRPDEFRLVRVVQRHQQLGVFSDVADKVLQVHEEAVGVHRAEQGLTPHFQVLKPRLQTSKTRRHAPTLINMLLQDKDIFIYIILYFGKK